MQGHTDGLDHVQMACAWKRQGQIDRREAAAHMLIGGACNEMTVEGDTRSHMIIGCDGAHLSKLTEASVELAVPLELTRSLPLK